MINKRQFRQQRLFAPVGMTKKPHQMTPLEFADSPRTWWHASDEEDFENVRSESQSPEFEAQGFHVGTLGAAEERIQTRSGSGVRGYLHPVRFSNHGFWNERDNPQPGGRSTPDLGVDQGNDWLDAAKPQYYVNEHEDKGSVSAVLESPHDVTHYADYVHEALDRGGIPSGQAEYFATQHDSEERERSPGFPRSQFESPADEPFSPTPQRRLRAREDAYVDPVSRAHRALGGLKQHHQARMLREVDTYSPEGERTGRTWAPEPSAVPSENLPAFDAAEEERKRPWLDRLMRGEEAP